MKNNKKFNHLNDQVKAFVHKYLEVDPTSEELIVDYALKTWEPLPSEVKYLQFTGEAYSGKTRACKVMEAICRHPVKINGGSYLRHLFEAVDKAFPCVLIIDAVDSRRQNKPVKILEAGNSNNKRIMSSATNEDGFSIKSFNVFGYKAITSRRKFSNPAIQSRCIEIKMRGVTRDDIPLILDEEFGKDCVKIQRDLKYFYGY